MKTLLYEVTRCKPVCISSARIVSTIHSVTFKMMCKKNPSTYIQLFFLWLKHKSSRL